MSDCNCTSAPVLSGPGFANVTKLVGETVVQAVDWCISLPTGASIAADTWDVVPITDPPLTLGPQGVQGLVTECVISGGAQGQLYRVEDTIGSQGPQGTDPHAMLTRTIWVWIPLDNTPAIFTPCAEDT